MPSPVFVAVAGNIGAGKSSLTRLLAKRFGWVPYFESVDDNPYLPDFYADMKRWSFHLQMYFLANRFKNHKKMIESGKSVIQDRSIYEDAEIFARNLYEMGNMEMRDYENYTSLFGVMMEYLKPPDLMIYLRSTVDTLLDQISRRGRTYEQSIRRDYLELLNRHYEEWIGRYSLGALLIVRTDGLDFVGRKKDFEDLAAAVEKSLALPSTTPAPRNTFR
ncbi:MAG: deoxynucleoside kinase [Ignavibacteriales bacterium]|nr:deoxynucleoside kinase [Ignavibacteriales bacterium]